MNSKLTTLYKHYEEIMHELSTDVVAKDIDRYTKLMKEQRDLEPIVSAYKAYLNAEKLELDSLAIIESENDKEMLAMAREDLANAKKEKEKLDDEIKILLIPKDPMDDKNIIIEIRQGAGGDEAALFATEIYKMYMGYAATMGWKTELMSISENGLGGIKEVIFMINGCGAYSKFKYESGVHRVQRVPITESSGRIHTSTITVAVMPEVDDVDIDINPADIEMEVFRASGAGGQHVNKTSSAVRITHIPTNIVVACQEERSQQLNKSRALQMLKAKLYIIKQNENAEKLSEIRGEIKENAFGSQIRSYVLQPYKMVKDLRTGEESANPDDIFDGKIENFINSYLKWLALGCPDRKILNNYE